MKSDNESWRHHYVPQFYLRQWITEPDNTLWRYRRLPMGKLTEDPVGTKATGFGEHLYSIRQAFPFMHTEPPDIIEKRFFQDIDDNAAKALSVLLAGGGLDATGQQDWALFLCSMLHRGAEELAERDAQAPALVQQVFSNMRALCKTPESAASMEETLSRIDVEAMGWNSVRQNMMREIQNPEHVEYLMRCKSRVVLVAPAFPLVTTDVPLMVNLGKSKRPVEVITCALSPSHLLLLWNPAEWDFGSDDEFHETVRQAVHIHNFMHCEGKARYLYSRDKLVDTPQSRLRTAVETRFGIPKPD